MNFAANPAREKKQGFLAAPGEMGKRTREFNWAPTPVGPAETWPLALKTIVSMLLNSRFPMFLWWGKELTQFYNDAYRPSLGNQGKHPLALGQNGKECWTEIWPIISPLISQVLNDGQSVWMENQLIPIYRNGQLEDVYWTFCYSPVNDDDGSTAGVLVTCSETTQQVYTEIKLTDYDQRFENLVKETPVGVVVLIGEDMRVDLANEMYGRLIGRKPDELTGKPLFSIIPEAADPFLGLLNKVRVTGEALYLYDQPYEVYVDGQKKAGFVNVVYKPYKAINGAITGVVALCHDVTEQVLIRKKIEEAESKARLAIESADLGTYEINLLTDEMKTSDRFNEIWGAGHNLTRSELVNRVHPDDRVARQAAHEQSLISNNLHYEARLLWKDGSNHWVRVKGKVLYNDSGVATTLLGVIQDITEQKLFSDHLTHQVKERTTELQRSNDDLLQFAHVISHDLKEPVRKIKVYSQRLEEHMAEAMPAKSRSDLEKIQKSTDRMFAMIDGVLNYSMLTSSEQSFEFIDLNEMMYGMIAEMEMQIQVKKATVRYENLPSIKAAAILIYQLFYNLLNNALKFSKKDEPPLISITGSLVRDEGQDFGKILFSDNGIGFEQAFAELIFTTFTRLNTKDEFEGTGLGLALCKKIVERHGGRIFATGSENSGAVFTVLLPVMQTGKEFNKPVHEA
jgi:PAS domain S-box-containing protein